VGIATPVNIAGWVRDAGWRGSDMVTATAIGLRVSDVDAPGGLWGVGTGAGSAQANQAFKLYQERGWGVFPHYRDGSWRLLVPVAAAAVAALAPVEAIAALPKEAADAINPYAEAAQAPFRVAFWLTQPQAWERVLKVILGVMLLTVAGVWFTKRLAWDPFFRTVEKVDDAVARQAGLTGPQVQPRPPRGAIFDTRSTE